MDAWDVGGEQCFGLPRGEFYADLKLPSVIVFMFLQIADELRGQLRTTERGNPLNLRAVSHGQQPRHNRHIDAQFVAALLELKEIGIVVKQLGDDHVAASIDLAFEIFEVGRGACCLLMRLGVAAHGDAHRGKLSADEFHQLVGIGEAASGSFESVFPLGRIASQRDDIFHPAVARLLEVVAKLVSCAANTGQVRGDWQVVALVYFGDYFQRTVLGRAAGAIGTGHVRGPKFYQSLGMAEQAGHSLVGFGREEFERKAKLVGPVGLCQRRQRVALQGDF